MAAPEFALALFSKDSQLHGTEALGSVPWSMYIVQARMLMGILVVGSEWCNGFLAADIGNNNM